MSQNFNQPLDQYSGIMGTVKAIEASKSRSPAGYIDWASAPEWATHWHPEFGFVQFNGDHWEDSQSTVLLEKTELISRGRPNVPPAPPVRPIA